MDTETTKVTDTRYSVFIELRERGMDACIARVPRSVTLTPTGRGRHAARDIRLVSVWSGITDFVDCFVYKGTLTLKPSSMKKNISTPYIVRTGAPHAGAESFFATSELSIVTTLPLRKQFALDCYTLATTTAEPLYKVSALKALEQLFFAMALNGEISESAAEKQYDRYEKISARIWRGQTPAEQLTSFQIAFKLLAKATGITAAQTQ